jgi:hypothetical protein
MGFKYEVRKKGYYVNSHEKEGTVEYKWKYVDHYLKKEAQMYCWIQITSEEAEVLESENKIPKKTGYQYFNTETGVNMVEYHVDTCYLFQEKMNATIQVGGNLSVRRGKNKETIIVLGHDECIFRQYALTNKPWNGPEEQKSITPKDLGQGIMISVFQSRAFGFGMDLSEQQLEEINFFRDGKKYADESAAIAKRGSAYKKNLLKALSFSSSNTELKGKATRHMNTWFFN